MYTIHSIHNIFQRQNFINRCELLCQQCICIILYIFFSFYPEASQVGECAVWMDFCNLRDVT